MWSILATRHRQIHYGKTFKIELGKSKVDTQIGNKIGAGGFGLVYKGLEENDAMCRHF